VSDIHEATAGDDSFEMYVDESVSGILGDSHMVWEVVGMIQPLIGKTLTIHPGKPSP